MSQKPYLLVFPMQHNQTKDLPVKKLLAIITVCALALSGCTRIETGQVGVRVGFDKQIDMNELQSGTLNQTLIGSVLTFPVKDVEVEVNNMTPLASDNSTIADFDLSVIYSLNPDTVSELYVEKSRGFHVTKGDDIYLMYQYIFQVARNATYKATRKYASLELADNRNQLEQEIMTYIRESLAKENLNDKINISQVLVRAITPAKEITDSANALVESQNYLKQKEVEVQTAKKEAERISALNANSGAIEYMQAMALMNISEGIKDGKVQTIVVPANFDSLMLGSVK